MASILLKWVHPTIADPCRPQSNENAPQRVVVTHYGGPEVITIIEEDIPTPKVGEIRVKVLASGVGLPDVLAREGVHPETPRVPYTPGWDLVGIVDLLGEGVTGFELRQTVAAMPIHGGYAQYACVAQRKLVPVPAELDAAEAASMRCLMASVETICGAPATALREGGRVVVYGFQSKMRGGRMASGSGGRHRIRESAELGWYIVRNWFKSRRKR